MLRLINRNSRYKKIIRRMEMNYDLLWLVLLLGFAGFATSQYPIKWLKLGIRWLVKKHFFGSISLDE